MAVEDPTKKQTEQVDPEVARILGLEDNFDLEYDEYMTLLREAMVKGAMDENSKLPEEDLATLANERKRIRELKESKFTVPKKTVNADSFFGGKKEKTTQKPITDTAKLLSGTVGASPIQKYKPPEEEPQEEKKDDTSDKLKEVENFLSGTLLGIVKEIRGLTEDILSILQKQFSAEKKGAELFRRESVKKEKVSKEKDLETKEEKKGLGLVEKITKPFTSIFDTIKKFITMVLLGSLVNWIFSVIKNPMMLLKPIQGLIDGITGFFNTVIQFIDNMVVQPVRNFIDTINSALNGFIDILNGALKILPGSPQIGPANIANIPEPPQLQAPDITGEKKTAPPKGPAVNLNFTGGSIGPTTQVIQKSTGGFIGPTTQVIQKVTGGGISGKKEDKDKLSFNDKVSNEGGNVSSNTTSFDISGIGPDKHLTALSTGEYVLKRGAADWLGGPVYLDKINQMFGGSTERRTANLGDIKIKAMNSGGQIGMPPSSSTPTSSGSTPSSSTPTSSGSTPSSSTPAHSSNDGSFKVNNKIFSPTQYTNNTKSTKHIVVGKNPPKSYVLRYQRQGATGTYNIKQINKVVAGAGFTRILGGQDNLTGVLPSSPEGQSVLNSANVSNYFRTAQNVAPAKSLKLKLEVDKDADIFYWYNQAYQTHYNDWRKKGYDKKTAREMAAPAAAEFAISRSKGSKGSWLPGSKQGAPEQLKTQGVESDSIAPASSGAPGASSENSQAQLSEADLSYSIKGDPAKESYVEYLKSQSSTPTAPPAPSLPPSPSSPSAPKGGGGESMMDVRHRHVNNLKSKNATNQRAQLGVVRSGGKNGKYILTNTGVRSGESENDWGMRISQSTSLANRLNLEQGLGKPRPVVAQAKTPTMGRSAYRAPISGVSALSPIRPSATTPAATSSPINATVSQKIAGGMEIYKKQKTSGDMKGAQETAKSVWGLANTTLAASSTERERIRGTQQTDNPLMKGMRSILPMNSPSIQSPDVSKLGKGNQSLVNNPNAFKSADPKLMERNRISPQGSDKSLKATPSPAGAPPTATNQPTTSLVPPAPTLPPSAATNQPTTSLVPPAPTLPPPAQMNQDLNQMTVEQLSKMLDPTVTGASNPAVFQAATKAREEGKAQGLIGESLEKKVLIATIQAKRGSIPSTAAPSLIAPSSITPTTKPNIPQPPSTEPNVSMLPLPPMGQGNKTQSTGMTKTGTTPVVHFNSYNDSEAVIVTTAALYNIWGM